TGRRRRSSRGGRDGSRTSTEHRRRLRSCGTRSPLTRSAGWWRPLSERRPNRSRRFVAREARELRKELLIAPVPELGLVAFDGPNDPRPELVVEDGRVTRIDGRGADEFDVIDHFLALHGLDLDAAADTASLTDE